LVFLLANNTKIQNREKSEKSEKGEKGEWQGGNGFIEHQ
jgi:hypothetical protein